MSCGFFPALDKAGWREAPGWFDAVIPPPGSGKEAALLPLPPLRTVLESFPSYGSSLHEAPLSQEPVPIGYLHDTGLQSPSLSQRAHTPKGVHLLSLL